MMKLLKLSLCLLLFFSLSACDDEEEVEIKVCTQSDWVGSFSGTIELNDGTVSDDLVITFSPNGTNGISFEYKFPRNTSTFPNAYELDNCEVNYDDGTLALAISVDGDQLTYTETFSFASGIQTRKIIATRDQ